MTAVRLPAWGPTLAGLAMLAAPAALAMLMALASGCGDGGAPGRADAAGDAADGPDGGAARCSAQIARPAPPTAGARRFRRVVLTTRHHAESAAIADLDCDGAADVVAGPYYYRGPAFTEARALYPAMEFDPRGWSDNFVAYAHDLDGDGWTDVLVTAGAARFAYWLRNPGAGGGGWTRHQVLDRVDNESPLFLDLTGDGRPELVFHVAGQLGWAGPDSRAPAAPWVFHPLSGQLGLPPSTHGLGVGDVDGDGRADVLLASGTFLQPPSLAGDPPWAAQRHRLGDGGGEIAVDDADGDGDADVITSIAAHGWGLSWFQQVGSAAAPRYEERVIVPAVPATTGVILHEPHALALHDLDGDGLRDIVTGERFWGHIPEGNPDFNAPARLYWFKLRRQAGGAVSYEPQLIDDASGIGCQLAVADATADGLPDIAVATKKGAYLFVAEAAP
jgi:hypothetical protein